MAEEQFSSIAKLSQGLGEAAEKVGKSVVAVDARPRVATSGVIWKPGVVVSTNHTIKRDEDIKIGLGDGRTFAATLVGRAAEVDLAVLKIENEAFESNESLVAQKSTVQPKVGNIVLAIGRTDLEQGVSASLGIVNLVGGKWRTWRGGGEIDRFIRLDTAIYLGFSGGALVDVEGAVLGINTSALARGAAITIPAATVDRVVEQILTRGSSARPFLGIGAQPVKLQESVRDKLGLKQETGLILLSVEAGGAAETGGLTIGDVLIALDDARIEDLDDVQMFLSEREVGSSVQATILRGAEQRELPITLQARSPKKR